MTDTLGVAEAKRRFSELVDRVKMGERIVVCRRGRPAVALVPPGEVVARAGEAAPAGLASVAGALADWEDLDEVVSEIYVARRKAKDRPAPDLG